jgi:16S rRNA (cytosine967-C5)-methyltransferase
MPEWICRRWTDEYGYEKTKNMLEFFLEPRPTVIRLNMTKFQGEGAIGDYIKELEASGVKVRKNAILPYALELEKTDNLRFLPGFDEGLFFVQDVSSMLVTEIADPKPGQTLIDVCASPGGKSLHAAERIENGTVLSRDVSERKCDLIRENAERMGLPNVRVELHDARVHDKELENRADVLYMDLPCSGLGIIGRKNDIKYNVTKKSLSELSKLQWEIIKTAWDYVKPGGILMYSTCTVNRAENEDMVARICKELPFETVDFSKELPGALKACDNDPDLKAQDGHAAKCRDLEAQAGKGFIQLLPGEYGTDGFFIAKLRRTPAGQS